MVFVAYREYSEKVHGAGGLENRSSMMAERMLDRGDLAGYHFIDRQRGAGHFLGFLAPSETTMYFRHRISVDSIESEGWKVVVKWWLVHKKDFLISHTNLSMAFFRRCSVSCS
jgi:hypothetical protein